MYLTDVYVCGMFEFIHCVPVVLQVKLSFDVTGLKMKWGETDGYPLALSAVLPSKSFLLFASFERELLNCMGSPKPPSEKAPCTFLLSNLSRIGSNFSDIIVKVDASFFLLRKLQVVQNLSSGKDYTEHSVV